MVGAFRAALALLPLLSSAILIQELPNSTEARSLEQPPQGALIQEHTAVVENSSGFPGIPMLGNSVQLALTQVVEPVKEKLQTIRQWIIEQLKALDSGLSDLKDKPGEALELFASKFATIFAAVTEKLEPVRSRLSLASPAIEGLKKVLQATGSAGAADKITSVMNSMSEEVISYQKVLSNCTEVAEGLRGLGQGDWHQAGPKVAEMKKYLDRGASALKSFGDSLQRKVEDALALLASKLAVEASLFAPVSQAAGDGWQLVEESSAALAAGMASASQSLPPQIDLTAPAEGEHSAAAAAALGALAAVAAALAP